MAPSKSPDETGSVLGAHNDPRRTKKEQVSYRHPLSSDDEIRRAGEQTSPQVARAAGLSRRRDEGGGSDSGSSPIRRFRIFWGLKKGPRDSGSEV